jgi:hypothetical protein
MKIDRIATDDIVEALKDRLIYGEVLEIVDGNVRIRPLCPAAGWHRATARQVVGRWRKTGRRASTSTPSTAGTTAVRTADAAPRSQPVI